MILVGVPGIIRQPDSNRLAGEYVLKINRGIHQRKRAEWRRGKTSIHRTQQEMGNRRKTKQKYCHNSHQNEPARTRADEPSHLFRLVPGSGPSVSTEVADSSQGHPIHTAEGARSM